MTFAAAVVSQLVLPTPSRRLQTSPIYMVSLSVSCTLVDTSQQAAEPYGAAFTTQQEIQPIILFSGAFSVTQQGS